MDKQTKATKIADIKRQWHLIDLKEKILGREASRIAMLLTGKSKPYFVRNLDCGDYVVVINAKDIKVSGKKESLKTYYRHSGYPGGFKAEKLSDLRKRRPGEIIKEAVKGMLPQNRLRDKMLDRLFIFSGEEHRYQDKFKIKN
ncbi:MAG: 50S ribosomal protein L13 [Patescibacteria group bacterium]|nr:50S ribosomal protein L13 [Patescibacteria group bacterium]